jgi:hypothetical protein
MTDEALQAELLGNAEETQEEETQPEVEEEAPETVADDSESSEEPQEEENSDINVPLGELLGNEEETDEPAETTKKVDVQGDTVPLALFLDLKREMKELESKAKGGDSNALLEAIADKHNVDVDFMREFADSIRENTAKEIRKEYEPFFNKQKEEAENLKKDQLFDSVYDSATKSFPELEGVLNKDLIKGLALDPKNSDKSVKQLIEWAYKGVMSKDDETPAPSFEEGSPSGGKKSGKLDFSNLSPEDHKTIADDPKLRKEYGDWVTENVRW